MKRILPFLFVFFYGYAILRYHFGKDVQWNEWYYILNKSFAWTGFTLITLSILKQSSLNKIGVTRKELGMSGFGFAVLHATSVLLLFNSSHYPKMYTGQEINFLGWITISIGILALLIFTIPFMAVLKNLPSKSKAFRMGKIGVFVSVFHPLVIGISGWFTPGDWPYYLPPITLLAVVFGTLVWVIRFTFDSK